MKRSTTLTFGACFGLLTLAGCSSSSLSDSSGSGGASFGGGSGSGGSASPAECVAPGYAADPAPAAVTIARVEATLHDPAGKAVANLPIQVCGLNLCLNFSTNAQGKTDDAPGTALVQPAFKYGDGFDFAELAVPLGADAEQDLGELVALPLPAFADGAAFPKQGSLTNGDLTLHIESQSQVEHDLLTYNDASDLVFRSASIPIAQSQLALGAKNAFELAFAVAPLGSTFCPAARLSVKNNLGWDAGTEVEVFVQGLDVAESWAPYGSWVKVADAAVSSDGSSIDTTSGGIPILSSIALRRK